jgi:hypothetical protein
MAGQTNWRGLPCHAVDDWDDWPLPLDEYKHMCLVHDMLVAQGADMELVREMMGFADRFRRMQEAEAAAGEDI